MPDLLIPDLTSEQWHNDLEKGIIHLDHAKVKMFRSSKGPGVFEIIKITREEETVFAYRVRPDSMKGALKAGGSKWLGAGRTFTSSKEALAHAHQKHDVIIAENKAS